MSKKRKCKKEWYLLTEGRRLAAYIGNRGAKPRKCKTNNELVALACQVFGIQATDIMSAVRQIQEFGLNRGPLGNSLVPCHCGSGRKRGWWKKHCKACENPASQENNVICLEDRRQPQKKIEKFYDSWEWKRLRYDFIKSKKRRCECCGASAADGARIVVDHIKPIRHFWNMRLDTTNLQILCNDCNMGKGSRDATDWRPANELR